MLAFIIFTGTALAVIAYCFIFSVVRYLYDPKRLGKYPNFSSLSGFTDLRHVYLSACGYRSRDLYEAHREKPILRTGPNSLSFGDIEAVRDIYGHGTKCIKDFNYVILGGTHTHLFDVVDRSEHSRKRKTLSAAFTIKNLERWEFKVSRTTRRLMNALDKYCTTPLPSEMSTPDPHETTLDFAKWINLFTIEAINSIALSDNMDLLIKARTRSPLNGWMGHSTGRPTARRRIRQRLPKLPLWRKVWQQAKPWNDVVYHQAATRLQRYLNGEQLDDFFSALMDSKQGKPNNLQWGEIVAEVSAIINAGADTTAIALTQVLELLLQNPQHLVTLRQEVDSVLEWDEIVAPHDKVKDLPFLRACLDEALRLIPPTSAGLPRRTPPEGAQILGEWIPGNTSVSMAIYATHRDANIFPDPESYQPERWLDAETRKRMEPYFIPFSAGARGCIGRNISYLEQTVVLASLVHRYEFALPSPEWKLARHEAFNLLVGEMPIKIWRREGDSIGCSD